MRLEALIALWEGAIADFLEGHPPPPTLAGWMAAYRGRGDGAVDVDDLPEPYLGPVGPRPKAVLLALNPGRADLTFHGRRGVFAEEIRQLGSYGAWAATWPYLRDPWVAQKGANLHHERRLAFLRHWFDEPGLTAAEMVSFELFPWHSSRINGAMRVDAALVREFIWEPLDDLGVPLVFAFGVRWFALVEALNLRVVDRLGVGGRPFPSAALSRAVLVAATPAGGLAVAMKHVGSAGPPTREDVWRLRAALGR